MTHDYSLVTIPTRHANMAQLAIKAIVESLAKGASQDNLACKLAALLYMAELRFRMSIAPDEASAKVLKAEHTVVQAILTSDEAAMMGDSAARPRTSSISDQT